MDALIIGFSRIVQKRVLPALAALPEIGRIHIASRRELPPPSLPSAKRGTIMRGYADALRQVAPPCLAYVSLPNQLHAEWVRAALDSGFHVIVDKPAFLDGATTETLVADARRRNLCLAEATAWSYHPQMAAARDAFRSAGTQPTRITTTFSFPPFPPTDWRLEERMGGGLLYDLGPYAVSCGRWFFGVPPDELAVRVTSRWKDGGVDTSFSVLATYPNGRSMVGHFGFDTEYTNRISVLGPRVAVDIDRAYTLPADAPNVLQIRRANQPEPLSVPASDSFVYFIRAVLRSIETESDSSLTDNLLEDARCLDRLRKAAGVH